MPTEIREVSWEHGDMLEYAASLVARVEAEAEAAIARVEAVTIEVPTAEVTAVTQPAVQDVTVTVTGGAT